VFGIAARVVPPAAVAPVAARVAVAASVTAPIAVAAAGIAIPVTPLCVGDTLQTQKGATCGTTAIVSAMTLRPRMLEMLISTSGSKPLCRCSYGRKAWLLAAGKKQAFRPDADTPRTKSQRR